MLTIQILCDLKPPVTTPADLSGHWQVTKAPPERRPKCYYEPGTPIYSGIGAVVLYRQVRVYDVQAVITESWIDLNNYIL